MPAKKDPNALTIDDVSVIKLHEVGKLSLDETAEAMNVSRETVKRIKKKPAYRDFVLAALEAEEYNATKYARQLIALTEAKKETTCQGKPIDKVVDNAARMKAIEKIGDILGVDAPKEYDLQHSLATKSDEELAEELGRAKQEYGLDEAESPDDDDAAKPV